MPWQIPSVSIILLYLFLFSRSASETVLILSKPTSSGQGWLSQVLASPRVMRSSDLTKGTEALVLKSGLDSKKGSEQLCNLELCYIWTERQLWKGKMTSIPSCRQRECSNRRCCLLAVSHLQHLCSSATFTVVLAPVVAGFPTSFSCCTQASAGQSSTKATLCQEDGSQALPWCLLVHLEFNCTKLSEYRFTGHITVLFDLHC